MYKFGFSGKRLHFIGIGGSGIFPIVQILKDLGYEISGSDMEDSATLKRVRQLGVKTFVGHDAANITNADMIIYSAAIPKDNPELKKANQEKIPTITRAEALGLITAGFQRVVCVAGTHGKTTTSALLTQMLLENDIDTTAIIGGVLPAIGGSGHLGKSGICICEACEYANTFLALQHNIGVVLNVDNDHLECFGSMDGLISAFGKFCSNAKELVIYNGDDKNTQRVATAIPTRKISVGTNPTNDYQAANIRVLAGNGISFDLLKGGEKIITLTASIPGKHNAINVLAAAVAGLELGLAPWQLLAPVKNFKGVCRRFEVLYRSGSLTIVDDYAHHPAELKATLETARQLPHKNIWAIFQPFTFSRTKRLLADFVDVLSAADHCVITDIMGSREFDDLGVSSEDLVTRLPNAVHKGSFSSAVAYVLENVPEDTLVITLGCGNIYHVANKIAQKMRGATK
ncbi:MAG: UDP-N-acetylmuramate--L-alanine ligase [Oscillospiraceae bacterium]|jgi:UDP-N-acetylmuramate--alanine ligase|nr:UDP-N-acetylmuramate--L-alanine ligase [Oscillospiraceae bacterium]